jgi:hypothetical protein
MADLNLKQIFHLSVSQKELLIILKALGSRLKTDEEAAEAKKLGDSITILRAKEAKQLSGENEKLIRSLKEHGIWNET